MITISIEVSSKTTGGVDIWLGSEETKNANADELKFVQKIRSYILDQSEVDRFLDMTCKPVG